MEYQLFAIDDGESTLIVRASQEAMRQAHDTDVVEVEMRTFDIETGEFCWHQYGVIDYTLARRLDRDPPVYVNAYRVTRHYGGPEEGGWWYEAGTPLASVPVPGFAPLICDHLDRLGKFFERNSWAPRGALQLRVELAFAQPWPATRPHYE